MATRTIENAEGFKIPLSLVPKADMAKHRAAIKLQKKVERLEAEMAHAKAEIFEVMDGLYSDMMEKAGLKEGKGNFTITTYDRQFKAEVRVSNRITFDDRIIAAQQLIEEYVSANLEGVSQGIRELINMAFKSKRGQLDAGRIMQLLSLQIKDEKWVQAMDLIRESIQRESSKRYLQFHKKDDNGEYNSIILNLSTVTAKKKPSRVKAKQEAGV